MTQPAFSIPSPRRVILLATMVLATLAVVAPLTARAASTASFTTTPALAPAFDPNVTDYVTTCASGSVAVSVTDTDGTAVSVDGQTPQTSSFATSVTLASGQAFNVQIGTATYIVRCLPPDFPNYTSTLYPQNGSPQAGYYLLTPGLAFGAQPLKPYVALFNNQGVPVWWYREATGIPLDANSLVNGDLSWDVEYQSPFAFGLPGGVSLEEHTLTGTLVSTTNTKVTPTDFHEGLQVANGDTLMTTFILHRCKNLSSISGSKCANVLDAGFQEISPAGKLVFWWDANGYVQPAESLDWINQNFAYPGVTGLVWDEYHINSIALDGPNFLISMRHTNAVWLINGRTKAVIWKLGGTTTSKSLTIQGDPDASTDFGGQHDARLLPNGDISVFDDGTQRSRPPRVLVFQVHPFLKTATLVQSFPDSTGAATLSSCCGSARQLPGGNWVVSWGGTAYNDEVATTSSTTSVPVLRIAFSAPYFSYRDTPILPGVYSDAQLQAAMNTMYPRTVGGSAR